MPNDPECERPTTSYKLACISSESSTSPFKIFTHKRMPGWHTDAYKTNITNVEKGGGPGIGERRELFPEEAIGRLGKDPIPFGVAFDEDWLGRLRKLICSITFGLFGDCQPNKWLGGSIPDQDDGEDPLTTLVRELAKRARNYNSALYLLRQYHYSYDSKKAPPETQANPYGPKYKNSLIPQPTDLATIQNYANPVECAFLEAACGLNDMVEPGADLTKYIKDCPVLVAADMIEVNGYIVSMRVVANPKLEPRDMRPLELSGSSSHVSISSEFSSYDDGSS